MNSRRILMLAPLAFAALLAACATRQPAAR